MLEMEVLKWQRLFGSIEENGKVGEIISLILKLSSEETHQLELFL